MTHHTLRTSLRCTTKHASTEAEPTVLSCLDNNVIWYKRHSSIIERVKELTYQEGLPVLRHAYLLLTCERPSHKWLYCLISKSPINDIAKKNKQVVSKNQPDVFSRHLGQHSSKRTESML